MKQYVIETEEVQVVIGFDEVEDFACDTADRTVVFTTSDAQIVLTDVTRWWLEEELPSE